MPLTRLANAVIDAVAERADAVAAEVAHYLGCDLACYRAEAPEELVAAQAAAFDPVLAWAREALGARFVAVAGRDARAAAAAGDRRRARRHPARPLAAGRGVVGDRADRLGAAGADAGARRARGRRGLGASRMSTRIGRCRNGAATRSRSRAAISARRNSTRRRGAEALTAQSRSASRGQRKRRIRGNGLCLRGDERASHDRDSNARYGRRGGSPRTGTRRAFRPRR